MVDTKTVVEAIGTVIGTLTVFPYIIHNSTQHIQWMIACHVGSHDRKQHTPHIFNMCLTIIVILIQFHYGNTDDRVVKLKCMYEIYNMCNKGLNLVSV